MKKYPSLAETGALLLTLNMDVLMALLELLSIAKDLERLIDDLPEI